MPLAGSFGTFGSETGMLLTPRLFKQDGTKTGVVYCHGANEDVSGSVNFFTWAALALAREGFPTISMQLGGLYTWGTSTATGKLANAITQLSNIGAKTSKLLFIGTSMGTLTILNGITQGAISASQIAAIVIVDPVIYLQNIHDTNRSGFQASIDAAFSTAYSASFASKMPALDPSTRTSSFTGIPIKIFVGQNDVTALPSEAQAFASNLGPSCRVQVLPGQDHGTTLFAVNPDDVVSFVRPYV